MLLLLQIVWLVATVSHFAVAICYLGPGVAVYRRRLHPHHMVGFVAASSTALRCIALGFWFLVNLILSVAHDRVPVSEASEIITLALTPVLILCCFGTIWSFWLDWSHDSENKD